MSPHEETHVSLTNTDPAAAWMPMPWAVSSFVVIMLLGLLVGLAVPAAGTDLAQILALASLPETLQWILLMLAAAGLAATWAIGLGHLTRQASRQQEHHQDMERSYRELEAFAATVSHDLRAPLRGIHLQADMAMEALRRTDSKAAGKQVMEVRKRSEQMSEMIDELLRCARNTAGHDARVSLPQLVEDAVDMAGLPPALEVRWAVPDMQIQGQSAVRLRHVIQNVVSNAAQHHDRKHGRIMLDMRVDGDMLHIVVDDDGPGIPAAQRETVFEMARSTRSQRPSGFGLAIVRRLTKEQGGDAAFVDKPGRGARLTIKWPVRSMSVVPNGQTIA